jgi:hypothetical protein
MSKQILSREGKELSRKGNTNVMETETQIDVQLHFTVIVTIDKIANTVTFRTGGHETVTTKRRMNQVCEAYGLPYSVFQAKYQWFVRGTDGFSHCFNEDGQCVVSFTM